MNITFGTSPIKPVKGFILLFAVVIISVTVGLSTALLIMSKRQAQIGSLQSETQTAFYAADMGMECALDWVYTVESGNEDGTPFTCGNATRTNVGTSNHRIYYFDFDSFYEANSIPWSPVTSCGVAVITKVTSANPISVLINGTNYTFESGYTVDAYGYSICQLQGGSQKPVLGDPALVERKLYAKVPFCDTTCPL